VLARRDLERWAKARKGLRQRAPEGVHDFRVALRRLRSTLRAFRPELKDLLPHRTRRRLRRLARAAGDSRNLQVSREWVSRQLETLSAAEQVGARWLLARLAARQQDTDKQLGRRIDKDFSRTKRRVRRAIKQAEPATVRGLVKGTNVVVRDAVRHWTEELERRLRGIRTVADWDDAHAARISVKRIRYLLKPFRRELAPASAALEQLSALQDALGTLQDARVLAAEFRAAFSEVAREEAQRTCDELLPWSGAIEPADSLPPRKQDGLITLTRLLGVEYESNFAALRREWLAERIGSLLFQLRGLDSHPTSLAPKAPLSAHPRRRHRSRRPNARASIRRAGSAGSG